MPVVRAKKRLVGGVSPGGECVGAGAAATATYKTMTPTPTAALLTLHFASSP